MEVGREEDLNRAIWQALCVVFILARLKPKR